MNKREIGKEKEQMASDFLQQQGYEILSRNFWCPFSEIDIVAREGEYLCFVEVKYRNNTWHGGCEGTISIQKQRKISQAARYYLAKNKVLPDTPIRFDVVFIIGQERELIRNAFDYID